MNTNKIHPRKALIGLEKEEKYPSNAKILDMLDQFARRTISMDFNELSQIKFDSSIYSNSIILGVGVKEYREIFNKNLMSKILSAFFKGDKKHIEAFELGHKLLSVY